MLSTGDVARVMRSIERAVPTRRLQIMVQRAARPSVLRAPPEARPLNMHRLVRGLAHIQMMAIAVVPR
jgi:hypothetical protein